MHYKKIPACPLYFILNKPLGYVCSSVSDSHSVVLELFPEDFLISPEGAKLHTAGRLDCNTEGLLIVTNDGKFSNYLTRPQNCISKTYSVKLRDPVFPEKQEIYIKRAAEGVMMSPDKKAGEQMSGSAIIKWEKSEDLSSALITLTEGKFHEVRRIFAALGNEVTALKRIKIETLELPPDLPPGKFIKLTREELKKYFPSFDF